MCGLTGFFDKTNHASRFVLERMTKSIEHRGPDGMGCDLLDTPYGKMGLGHTRLSILDLSDLGRQPMYSSNGKHAIIYNGEVYNFKQIRQSLEVRGEHFLTETDTEVILRSLMLYGTKALDSFVGMFSIVWYNGEEQKLFLIRDRAGVKPLYYCELPNLILFSSELRSFHEHPSFSSEIHMGALSEYLDYGYVRKELSIFNAAKKVLPGQVLVFDLKDNSKTDFKYWNIQSFFCQEKHNLNFYEAAEELESILIDAFKYRMVADVPVGVFMSGGVDSTTVAAILQKHYGTIKTFTIGFHEKEYDEAERAKRIAKYLNTEHHEYYCSSKELLDIFPKIPEIYDEPFSDKSIIPTTLVSHFAKSRVSVALSADGGDEQFAGYLKYQNLLRVISKLEQNQNIRASDILKALIGQRVGLKHKFERVFLKKYSLRNIDSFAVGIMLSEARKFGDKELDKLLGQDWRDNSRFKNESVKHHDILNELLSFDYEDYLPDDILTKVDRASMHYGLEAREPFLDHRIAEFSSRLPSSFKFDGIQSKKILRHINEKYIPNEFINGPKQGFSIPKKEWLNTHLKGYVNEYLSEARMRAMGIFSPKAVQKILLNYKKGYGHNQIWNLLIFSMWHERWKT